ncbi:MAG: radical SAM protein [Clostridia bacterium]|nr:radical SAM protein [Clostridia bacterium]
MHYTISKGILSTRNGMNLYRGCSHGCIYCDSRSKCYRMNHDFEDIEVKENAIELLESALKSKRKKCMIGMGSMTDPYIPLEMKIGHTRKALELILKYGFGVSIITKSSRVLRDIDLLKEINQSTKCVIQMTLTTFDEKLCAEIEPRVSSTRERYETLIKLRDAGIPTLVWLCPILPFINDTVENISGILDYCERAGVYGLINFGMGLTLRDGNREYFYVQLDHLFPGMKRRYIQTFGNRYAIESPNSAGLLSVFHKKCEDGGMVHDNDRLFAFLNAFEDKRQIMWEL